MRAAGLGKVVRNLVNTFRNRGRAFRKLQSMHLFIHSIHLVAGTVNCTLKETQKILRPLALYCHHSPAFKLPVLSHRTIHYFSRLSCSRYSRNLVA